jgi:hypothetical protein
MYGVIFLALFIVGGTGYLYYRLHRIAHTAAMIEQMIKELEAEFRNEVK